MISNGKSIVPILTRARKSIFRKSDQLVGRRVMKFREKILEVNEEKGCLVINNTLFFKLKNLSSIKNVLFVFKLKGILRTMFSTLLMKNKSKNEFLI